ncbi:6-phosphofructokinase [Salisediminibacterium selenitireducens]|uniref:ATP-dependent 6-phosphofructokinase n=1 Tax=Bacillus selenitireducens (strain ATCC 700615 / DSM 15326 / MLS10) TaxID=439292 RepID=D6XUM6_BACIE|nr:6-phosphofructokinase [Salisediminibacterium selenitireducens]ADH99512.1 6-phosphofructokinase [[Bacillus] selenitireducens MLS10]
MNKIAVLTSGGDAPGMNAAIRAVVSASHYHGIEVYGVYRGYKGLMDGSIQPLTTESVAGVIHKGGTILKSARSEEFKQPENRQKGIDQLRSLGIKGLVVIGGDGSFIGAQKLAEEGIATIALPGTIDNDLAYTDETIGFDTAVNTVLDAITKIRDTSFSHEKPTIIEVMGRYCGDIALYAGIAGGAGTIIIPEEKGTKDQMIEQIRQGHEKGSLDHIIMLAEGVQSASSLQSELKEKYGISSRISVLGFIQRGGDPTSRDRILASRMGVEAVELLKNGHSGRAVGIRNNQIYHLSISHALKKEKTIDQSMYHLTNLLSL